MSKTDRRKWNKSIKGFDLEYPDVTEDIRKRYDDYLTNLHVQNQMMKVLNEKDPKEAELQKKENGFSLYVNGAHKLPERFTPRHAVTSSSNNNSKYKKNLPVNFIPKLHIRKESDFETDRCKSAPINRRKQWLNSSITIKTMDGLNIKLCAPGTNTRSLTQRDDNNESQNYYSDDFVTDTSDEESNSKNNFNNDSNVNSNNCTEFAGSLIKSVKFSDTSSSDISIESDLEEKKSLDKTKNKKCLKLSKADIKFLRESINNFKLEVSDDSLEEDLEIDCKIYEKNSDKLNHNKTENENNNNKISNNISKLNERKSQPLLNKNCDLILHNIGNLDMSERKLLFKFLKSVDENSID